MATIAAAMAWRVDLRGNSDLHEARINQEISLGRRMANEACRNRTGEKILVTVATPSQAYVRIVDPKEFDGAQPDPRQRAREPKVHFVTDFPAVRPDGAVFIEARVTKEPMAGLQGGRVDGTLVEVRSSTEQLLAQRVDTFRNQESCLGPDSQGAALHQFVKRVTGIDIGRPDEEGEIGPVGSFAVPGNFGPIENGHFTPPVPDRVDFIHPRSTSKLAANGCTVVPKHPDDAVCADGTPQRNELQVNGLLAGIATQDGWLGIGKVSPWADVDMLDVVHRSRQGAITARWRVRFEPIPLASVAVETARLEGQTVTVDLLFDDDPNKNLLRPSVLGSFGHRTRLSIDLLPVIPVPMPTGPVEPPPSSWER